MSVSVSIHVSVLVACVSIHLSKCQYTCQYIFTVSVSVLVSSHVLSDQLYCVAISERAMAHCGSAEVLVVGGVGCKWL